MPKRAPAKTKKRRRPAPRALATWVRVLVISGTTYVGLHVGMYLLQQFGALTVTGRWGGLAWATWLQIAEVVATILVTSVVTASSPVRVHTQSARETAAFTPVSMDRPLPPPVIAEFFVGRSADEVIHDLALLYKIGQGISTTIDLQELLDRVTDLVQRHLALREFAVLLLDDERRYLRVRAAYGFQEDDHVQDMVFRVGEGISGEVARSGTMILVPDTHADPRYLHYRRESRERGALVSIPLEYKQEILGVVNFGRRGARSFSDSDTQLLQLVANQISIAIANARLYSQTRELAIRDDLTGLYNRRHFLEVLQVEWKRALRFRRGLAVLMIDVDHFKAFNDTHGHLYGDEVLRQIADILRRNLREVDTLARFGGEEFIALLPDTDKAGALHVGEKLRRIVDAERFPVPDSTIFQSLTISVGVSVYPDDALQIDDLIDHADVGLYEAKDGGRNRVVPYPSLQADDAEHTPVSVLKR